MNYLGYLLILFDIDYRPLYVLLQLFPRRKIELQTFD